MNTINRTNYELYFADFLDGNLHAALLDEFNAFVMKNPDLACELKLLNKPVILSAELNSEFKGKRVIKSPDTELKQQAINDENITSFLIASHENDLNELQQQELIRFLKNNAAYNLEYQYYKASKLKKNPVISIMNKEILYNREYKVQNNKVLIVFTSTLAAALFALLIISGILSTFQNKAGRQNLVTARPDLMMDINKSEQNEAYDFYINKRDLQPKAAEQQKNQKTVKLMVKEHDAALQRENATPYLKEIQGKWANQIAISDHTFQPKIENAIPVIESNGNGRLNKNLKSTAVLAGKNSRNLLDPNNDEKFNTLDVLTLTSRTINRISGNRLINIEFTTEGRFSEFALGNDLVKISKSSKN